MSDKLQLVDGTKRGRSWGGDKLKLVGHWYQSQAQYSTASAAIGWSQSPAYFSQDEWDHPVAALAVLYERLLVD